MKPNWNDLRNKIPSKIKTKYKTSFDVLWQDNPTDKKGTRLFGCTTFDPNQIVLDTQQSDKEAVMTYWHEALHAFADSYEVKLTEPEVRRLEKAFLYFREFFLRLEGKE